jgi:hypothetical protein
MHDAAAVAAVCSRHRRAGGLKRIRARRDARLADPYTISWREASVARRPEPFVGASPITALLVSLYGNCSRRRVARLRRRSLDRCARAWKNIQACRQVRRADMDTISGLDSPLAPRPESIGGGAPRLHSFSGTAAVQFSKVGCSRATLKI